MSTIEVKVPNIGDFEDVPVIEVLVKPGDSVKAEDSLVTLESDKATMDVPSPSAGTVKALSVKVGDKVKEGSLILTLDSAAAGAEAPAKPAPRARFRASAASERRRPISVDRAAKKAWPMRPARVRRRHRLRAKPSRCAFPTSAISATCRSSRSS